MTCGAEDWGSYTWVRKAAQDPPASIHPEICQVPQEALGHPGLPGMEGGVGHCEIATFPKEAQLLPPS